MKQVKQAKKRKIFVLPMSMFARDMKVDLKESDVL